MRCAKPSVLWASWVLLAVACGPSGGRGDDSGDDDAPPESCTTAGANRCSGQDFQECTGDTWQTEETCAPPFMCTATGCSQCDPSFDQTCVGSDLYACNDDGSLGGLVVACGAAGCSGQSCGAPTGDDCSDDTQVIYVVDKSYNLLSFDPRMDAHTFTLIGQLDCPAGTPWPALLQFTATPFSMSIDREGRAWVLYTSGEIFLVDTTDASCTASGFVRGAQGFELFGMGFVADAPGSDTEKLFIVGGPDDLFTGNTTMSKLGSVDTGTFAASVLGPLPTGKYGPDLSGTGDAQLWGFFPGSGVNSVVARVDQVTGAKLQTFDLGSSSGSLSAWAFAHYGGRFYIFVSDGLFGDQSKVMRLDPAANGGAGQTVTVVASSPYVVVGAGVSTCAPVVVE